MKNRLYVGNLSFETTEEGLKSVFGAFGDVTEVKLISDRETGRSRGFGFVVMSTDDQAQVAIDQMNGALVEGRSLKVSEAQERSQPEKRARW